MDNLTKGLMNKKVLLKESSDPIFKSDLPKLTTDFFNAGMKYQKEVTSEIEKIYHRIQDFSSKKIGFISCAYGNNNSYSDEKFNPKMPFEFREENGFRVFICTEFKVYVFFDINIVDFSRLEIDGGFGSFGKVPIENFHDRSIKVPANAKFFNSYDLEYKTYIAGGKK